MCQWVKKLIMILFRRLRQTYARSISWARIFGIGEMWGHEIRVREEVRLASGLPPPIYGLPKDHKTVSVGQEHPLRPVCGANSGPGSRISNILAQIMEVSCNYVV